MADPTEPVQKKKVDRANESVAEMRERKVAGAPERAEKREEIKKDLNNVGLFAELKPRKNEAAIADLAKTREAKKEPEAAQLQRKKEPNRQLDKN